MTLKEIQAIEKAYQDMEIDKDDKDDGLSMNEKEEEVIEKVDNGNMLVLKRACHVQNGLHDDQRVNIFQTRCTINDKVCSIINDSGSCANVASTTLVEKLKLPISPHP